MRLKLFLASVLAVLACGGGYLELAARCRCDRPARGERKSVRQERRSARRGYSAQYSPATPSVDPYTPGVQPLGATARPEYRWECNGRSCRLVPVAPQAKAADCPPATAPTKTPEPEPTTETKEVTTPDPATAWRPIQPQLPGWDD